jgi:hypothetical protein
MKIRKTIMLVALAVLAVVACKEKKDTNRPVLSIQSENEEADTTAYGKCFGAAMNSLMLVTDNGDTIAYMLETDTVRADVQGGLFDGDKLAILANNVDGTMRATKVINLTTLLGKWTNVARNFDIKDGGVVESHVSAESKPYTSWKIYNGKLILSTDTFEITTLGPDSLYLENDNGIFAFKRQL